MRRTGLLSARLDAKYLSAYQEVLSESIEEQIVSHRDNAHARTVLKKRDAPAMSRLRRNRP